MTKPKVAFYWCASCGGCEETVVDLEEKILDVVAAVDIVFWPVAMDFKRSDVEALPDNGLLAAFINGAIRTSEQEDMVRLLRRKARVVVAFGICAAMGGIPALANTKNKAGVLRRAYLESPSTANPDRTLPDPEKAHSGYDLHLPVFYETVRRLDEIVVVDYYLPGCPPTSGLVFQALTTLLGKQLPPAGAVLAPDHSLCRTCPRNASKPERISWPELKRIHQIAADPDLCFLAQGVLCMGPATRGGCEELCIRGNMPCTGCFGPLGRSDQGARMLSALAGLSPAQTEEEVDRLVASVADPAGSFYRYSLAASLLAGRDPKLPEPQAGIPASEARPAASRKQKPVAKPRPVAKKKNLKAKPSVQRKGKPHGKKNKH